MSLAHQEYEEGNFPTKANRLPTRDEALAMAISRANLQSDNPKSTIVELTRDMEPSETIRTVVQARRRKK